MWSWRFRSARNPLDAKEVLEEVGLGDRLDNFPAQLSGGEQQRVSIAEPWPKTQSSYSAMSPRELLIIIPENQS